MQLNAPEYDLDIDGQPDPVTDVQSPNAKNIKEDTKPDTTNSEQHTAPSLNTNRPESQPSSVLDDTDYPGYQDNGQPRAEDPSDYRPQLEDIPELEDDEENWEEGQFADTDLIDHHNTTEESDRICREYSVHFEKVTEQGYSPYHSTTQGVNIRSLNQNITTPTHDQNNTRGIKIQMYISLPHHLLKICAYDMVMDREELNIWSCIAIDCMGRKQDH